jgi:molybdopterin/thiamine biosynthesis adenylyltransferase
VNDARYNRHNLIDWFSQEAVANSRVAVIGAGAVGNEVVKNLALLGVGGIHIFDLDLIEEHNLTRSVLFRDTDIGRSKAEVAAERAEELDANVSAVPFHGDFWDCLSLSQLRTFDVVFCCVDNFEARIRCNTLCYLARVDFINMGIDSRSAVVEVFPFSRTLTAGCFECNLPPTVYRRISERYSCGYLRKLSFIEKKIPTTIITSTVAAALAVSFGLRLGAQEDEATAKRVYIDTISGNSTRTTLGHSDGCVCCGRFSGDAYLMTSQRRVDDLPAGIELDATIITSEPILASYRIAGEDREHLVFKNASSFDSRFPETLSAVVGAVDLEVRDQFTISEIVQRFAGCDMPCKFAIVSGNGKVFLCEFEGQKHE